MSFLKMSAGLMDLNGLVNFRNFKRVETPF
jgi:hypothetical protein